MITDYETKDLKINTALRGKPAGSVIKIKTDKQGTALDPYWRRRLKDSKIDKCVEFVQPKKPAKIKSKEDSK